jgi:hypothetical protein
MAMMLPNSRMALTLHQILADVERKAGVPPEVWWL